MRTYYALGCVVCGEHHNKVQCLSVRPSVYLSVCLSRRSTAAAAAGGFAAELRRGPAADIDRSRCRRTTCGPRKFWSDCKEVQRSCLFAVSC